MHTVALTRRWFQGDALGSTRENIQRSIIELQHNLFGDKSVECTVYSEAWDYMQMMHTPKKDLELSVSQDREVPMSIGKCLSDEADTSLSWERGTRLENSRDK